MLKNEDYKFIFHEIKNSVAVIGCSLQLIEKKHPEVKDFPFWEDTLADVAGLRQMILEVSSTSLCENPQKSYVNLYDFLSVLRTSAHSLFDDDAVITFDIPFGLPEGYFDTMRIHHALLNLIKNASEAMNRHGTLTIRTYCRKNHLCFDVCDSGCGIPPEIQDQIFNPFFSSKEDGSGLGLVIAKGIIESHGGTLSLASTMGQGTTFTISLPLTANQNEKSDPVCEAS